MTKIPDRTFGVELEVAGLSQEQAFLVLRMAGLPVEDPYRHEPTHIRMEKWRFHGDGSIQDTRNNVRRAVEVVSPILSGAKGLKQVRKACAALVKAGAYVNESCGLHVHVGAQDLTPSEIITLCQRYATHGEFIDSVLHPTRRGDENRYCHSVQRTLNDLDWNRYVSRLTRDMRSHQEWLTRYEPLAKMVEKVATGWSVSGVMVADLQAHFSGKQPETPTPAIPLPREMACYECQRGRGQHTSRIMVGDYAGSYTGSMNCPECRCNVQNFRHKVHAYRSMIKQIQDKIDRGQFASTDDMINQVAERYRSINLHSLPRHGTVEFRQHHGALSADKVAAWITFVLNFVERSRQIAKLTEAKKATKVKDSSPLVGLPKRIKTHFEARRKIKATARYETWA